MGRRDETGKWDVATFRTPGTRSELRRLFLFEENVSFVSARRSFIASTTCQDVELQLPNVPVFLPARLRLRNAVQTCPFSKVRALVWTIDVPRTASSGRLASYRPLLS